MKDQDSCLPLSRRPLEPRSDHIDDESSELTWRCCITSPELTPAARLTVSAHHPTYLPDALGKWAKPCSANYIRTVATVGMRSQNALVVVACAQEPK